MINSGTACKKKWRKFLNSKLTVISAGRRIGKMVSVEAVLVVSRILSCSSLPVLKKKRLDGVGEHYLVSVPPLLPGFVHEGV